MRMSLKKKAILMIVIVGLLIGIAAILVYNNGINALTTNEYESRSVDIANAMAQILDADKVKTLRDSILDIYTNEEHVVLSDQWGTPEFDEYISKFSHIENTEEFQSLRTQLRKVQDAIDVDCLYIAWLDLEGEHYIYLVDGAYEDACPPGCVDPLFLGDSLKKEDLKAGCPPNVTHTEEYGYLMSTAKPITTSDGEIVGYAAVDLSMNKIMQHIHELLLVVILVFGIVTFIACLIGILVVDKLIVKPINTLSDTAETYTANELRFSEINIHTGDEIETLADSIKCMERDIKDYYNHLLATMNDLETVKEHAEVLKREANIDTLTNLYNKRAYNIETENLEKNGGTFAIVMIDLNGLKSVNDTYGHDKGDIAIRNTARIICKVFKNSHKFRIGGDEFVVVLTDGELNICDELIEEFRNEVNRIAANEKAEPWEKLTAACGYAVYDEKTDNGVESVFKRADEEMYENKMKMKEKNEENKENMTCMKK